MSAIISSCRVKVNADGDWQILPPAGQITRVGNAIGVLGPPATNDDLLVSGAIAAWGKIAAGADLQSIFPSETPGAGGFTMAPYPYGEMTMLRLLSEEITIPIGSGLAGVLSVGNMYQNESVIEMIFARVTQAPGGGATWFSVFRTATPGDVHINQCAVPLSTRASSIGHSDGTHDGPWNNDTTQKLTIITDANVIGTDMKVRVGVQSRQLWNFSS